MMLLTISLQKRFFLIVAFLLGSVAPLYGNAFNFLLLTFVLLIAIMNRREFTANLKKEYEYLLIPFLYLLYFTIHTLIVLVKGNPISKPAYSGFEALLLCFILVPVYISTIRPWFTVQLLERFLFYFCLGCLFLNLYVLFDLTGTRLFSQTKEALVFVYNYRFGDNREVLGGFFFLEPRALYIVLSALISYYMVIVNTCYRMKVGYGMMFLIFLIFLSFTVTKGSILAFVSGFILINFYICKVQTWKIRFVIGGVAVVLLCFAFLFGESISYQNRMEQMKVETKNVMAGDYSGGSIAPRVAFFREAFKHVDEFGVWGLGVCAKNRVQEWYRTSDADIWYYSNVHNAFLYNWIQGGIVGLAFLLFLFIAPIWRMIRRKKFSYLVLASIVMIFITSNTCVMFSLSNSRSFILFLFAMFYFYSDTFAELERTIRKS